MDNDIWDIWYNQACDCDMCTTYRHKLIKLTNQIEQLDANYEWDDTYLFIENL